MKKINWADMPIGVATDKGVLLSVPECEGSGYGALGCFLTFSGGEGGYAHVERVELDTISPVLLSEDQQPWILYEGQTIPPCLKIKVVTHCLTGQQYVKNWISTCAFFCRFSNPSRLENSSLKVKAFKVTGLKKGWEY